MSIIEDKFDSLLFGGLNLGSPLGNEETLTDGGAKQLYQFGAIYFHPRVGAAFECHGLILQTYVELGEQTSGLGYPVSDEMDNPDVPGGRMNVFEFGQLVWSESTGVRVEFDRWSMIPQVVVKLHDEIPILLSQGGTLSLDQLESAIGPIGGGFFDALFRDVLSGLPFRRLFEPPSAAEIQELCDKAQALNPGYTPPNFENFLVLDCPEGFDTESLVAALSAKLGLVEYAYTSPVLEDAVVVGTGNPLFSQQGHLGSVNGINVQAAWAKGGDGSGTRFIDIERGWLHQHRDLPQGIPLLDGHNFSEGLAHGCAVLGVVVGVDDNKGIVGIAPRADVALISRVSPTGVQLLADQVAAMILKAAILLDFGDVVLLETTAGGRPAEILPPIFEAIKLATTSGVVVVEPAGNGGHNLDDFRDENGRRVLSRNVPGEFKDSGAIVVGAGTSAFPHRRVDSSSFGSRVDCYAWGENIVTTGNALNTTDVNGFMNDFSGTSGASAIMAGVCLLIQDLQLRLQPISGLPLKLPPRQLRRVVSKPENGTASLLASDQIGVMPDFQKIIGNEFV